jgi:hypothetical protein
VTLACSVTGPTTVPASAVTCGPTTTVDLSGPGRDGLYTVLVTATDAAGNTSAAGTASYVLDTTPPPVPTVTLTTPASSLSNVTHPQFSVTDTEVGVTFTCQVSGPTTVPGSAVTCGSTTTVDLSGTGRDGTYTVSVTATDVAGNTSPAGTATYTLDTTPPPAPTVTLSPTMSTPSNVTSPQFLVTDTEAGVSFDCSVSGPTTVPASAISCGSTTTVDLPDGPYDAYTLSVTATDQAGNTSAVGTAVYVLDTTKPRTPIVQLEDGTPSSNNPVSWTWNFGYGDTRLNQDTATCTVIGPNSNTWTYSACPRDFTATLQGGDGDYVLKVTLTDEAGNLAWGVSSPYDLDTRAPHTPKVKLLHPAGGVGLDRNPVWSVNAPPNTTLKCSLQRGGTFGTVNVPLGAVVSPPLPCLGPTATYSLAGMPDGLYTIEVQAFDRAKNPSAPAPSTYVLLPGEPVVNAPTSQSPNAVWNIQGDAADSYICTLQHDSRAVVGPAPCTSSPSYDMSGRPAGQYTLSAVAVGDAGIPSTAGKATWTWDGIASPPPPPPPPPGGNLTQHHHPAPSTSGGGLPVRVPNFVEKLINPPVKIIKTVTEPLVNILPRIVPDRVGAAVAGAVHAAASPVGRAGFPLLLLGLLLGFLLLQNRIDRRDPKLALASIAADDTVEFQPPPSQEDRP